MWGCVVSVALSIIGGALVGHAVVVLFTGMYSRAAAAAVLAFGLLLMTVGMTVGAS